MPNSSTTIPASNKPSNPATFNIGILGLGSIGCLIASQLLTSQQPRPVKLFALTRTREAQFDFILDNDIGSNHYQLPVWKETAGTINGSAALDVLIVCVKASQTLNALAQWAAAIDTNTQIVLLQNGLGQHDQVLKLLANNTLFAATTTEGANRVSRHHVKHAGHGMTQWGYYAGPKQPLILDLSQLVGEHVYNHDIKQALLDKLAINAVINPLTVKYNCPNGDLLTAPEAFSEFRLLCAEIEKALRTLGLSLSFSLFERAQQVAKITQDNISSMLQDVRNQQETEIDFINQYLIQQAKTFKLDLPINQSLVDLVRSHSLSI